MTFPQNIPPRLLKKIDNNAIAKQFLLSSEEKEKVEGFSEHPLEEDKFRFEEKLLKKYHGRALLLVTKACCMHCRFCFRRHFDYNQKDVTFEKEILALSKDATIREVILSGGDPLSLNNDKLENLLNQLGAIQHIETIRFHTRFPIGRPERIDDNFVRILQQNPKQIIFVIHCNHPKELDRDVYEALRKILCCGIPVLNQSVLLKDVNDDSETLSELSWCLIKNGVIPYYLHQLDKVQGAAHFFVEEEKGKKIIEEMMQILPGYAVPKYVKEIPDKFYKVNV